MDIQSLQNRMNRLLDSQKPSPEHTDYSILNYHMRLLGQLALVENSSMTIYDILQRKYVFVRNRFRELIDYDEQAAAEQGYAFFFRLMPPDDIAFVLDTSIRSLEYLHEVPPAERKDYKTVFEFRLRNREGKYIRFIQQLVNLELDLAGNMWLILILMDVNPNQQGGKQLLRTMMNMKSGKVVPFTEERDERQSQLTRREIEILGLIARGMVSKEIAEQLFLSVNTVNNHRQRIIEKMDMSSTSEALTYAMRIGII
jgi:DNA-binding CsgD family transcriptional regulator/PAS domain-containing protein